MSDLPKLASSLGRRDEKPNQELELVENLNYKDKNIQRDCIKVIYEIGESKPALLSDYAKEFQAD